MLRLVAALWAGLLLAGTAAAAEAITAFNANVTLERNGAMEVTETIRVAVEGIEIRRGIYRDIPLTFLDDGGVERRVDFEVISVERDGRPEPFSEDPIEGGTRLTIGDAEVMLDPGEHSYDITYRTNRQIRFFDDHDELSWNVTGNFWRFPILEATATITLPEGVRVLDTAVFTGRFGEKGKDARGMQEGQDLFFAATRPLSAGEGLTVAVKFEKGAIVPTEADLRRWWLADRLGLFFATGGFLLVFAYYFWSWSKVGRDPARGVMVPRWDPPGGLSASLIRYVDNKGFRGSDWTAFTAAALQLAVDGYVTLDDLDETVTLTRTAKPLSGPLHPGEAALLSAVGKEKGSRFVIDKAHGQQVLSAGDRFRTAVEKEHRNKYYLHNTAYTVGGVLLSLVVLAATLLSGAVPLEGLVALAVPTVAAVMAARGAVAFGKGALRGRSIFGRIMSVVGGGLFAFVALAIVAVELIGLFALGDDLPQTAVLVAIGGIVFLNLLFFFLMGAPTPLGRTLMDGIEGLRQYLTFAEKDRMNLAGAPRMSPRHFETLLPYAVALGVEKPWSEAFDAWLATAAAGTAAAAWHPAWYAGHGFDAGHIGRWTSGVSDRMTASIASSLPAPVSSSSSSFDGGSSGGGGFSGGGGGGGGGGGW